MTRRRPLLVALRALKLGDLLTGLPALRALRRAFPEHRTVLLAPSWLSHLAAHAGAADEVFPHAGLLPVPRCLHGADIAVDLHGRGPGSQPLLLQAKPKHLMCFAHPEVTGTEHGARWLPVEHETARWCRMLNHYGIDANPDDLDIDLPPLSHSAMAHMRGWPGTGFPASSEAAAEFSPTALAYTEEQLAQATIVHPGAASGSRRWPVARFAAVARHELEEGRPVLVTAGPGETALADELAAAARRRAKGTSRWSGNVATVARDGNGVTVARDGNGVTATRRLMAQPPVAVLSGASLLTLAAVVGRAGRLVSGDTGVSHLATALRVPSVVLCGPVGPHLWGPPASRPWHVALWTGRDGDPHGSELDPGLNEITVDQVLAALDGLGRPMQRTGYERTAN